MKQLLKQSKFPKMRIMRSVNFSRRPFRLQMTCYLFLFRQQLRARFIRVRIVLSAQRWQVSFEHPTHVGLLKRQSMQTVQVAPPPRHLKLMPPVTEAEPEIEIIPLAPAWRQAA